MAINSLKIVVADDEQMMRQFLTDTLTDLGHDVVGVCKTGEELIEVCKHQRPDFVITDIRMPGMDGLQAAEEIHQRFQIPSIVVTAYYDAESVHRADAAHVFGYLVKPIQPSDIAPALEIAKGRFAEFESLKCETASLRQALDDRKVIERAKGILMKQAQIDEAEAFVRLQKTARSSQNKLVEVARMIILSSEAMS